MKRMLTAAAVLIATAASSQALTVPMAQVDAMGGAIAVGEISIVATDWGLVFTPALRGLPPGLHGFHLHEQPSCAAGEKDGKLVAALAAGGHYDPHRRARHGTPWGDGHLGDLPPLYVDDEGRAAQPVLAPRVTLGDLAGRSLMVHAGGDNHADHPAPMGGGGTRMLCGVVP